VQLVADVQSLMRERADAKGLGFDIEFIGAIPETITSDPTRVRQILINLIGNAIKFTEEGGGRLMTRVVDDDDKPLMQFDVVDTGLGMTKKHAARLFQPFTQADASTTRKFGGAGLGLTVSKRLAEMLGGDVILVDYQEGLGTRFRATVATGPLDAVRMIDDPPSATWVTTEGSRASASADRHVLEGCHILLAEDHPTNQVFVARILKKTGAEVTAVENGKLAVEKVLAVIYRRREGDPEWPFDVILMDMQMSVMDGYEATGLLRQEGYAGPIIALTAHAMASDRQKCIDAACDDYASKPINRKKLLATIRTHLRRPVLSSS